MVSQRTIESFVGFFLLLALLALMVLAFKVSGLTSFFREPGYEVSAYFDEVGQLKIRSAVKIGGVTVGEVTRITLDAKTFQAVVKMQIHKKVDDIPTDSSFSIMTAGLLGDNYVAITPMYGTEFLKEGSVIRNTHPAIILEKMIGQLMFKLGNNNTQTGEKK